MELVLEVSLLFFIVIGVVCALNRIRRKIFIIANKK